MTIEEMIRRKQELGYSYERISDLSGVPLGTVQKIFSGQTKSPRYGTLRALEKMFLEVTGENRREGSLADTRDRLPADGQGTTEAGGRTYVKDSSFIYKAGASRDKYDGWRGKKQGEFTLEDYYALPDDQRAELIDGVIYDMTAPTTAHQQIILYLGSRIREHILTHKGKCVTSIAPTDVRLDMDDRTMVQPDVLVVCQRDQMIARRIEGAPDLVIEILSPSTRRKDLHIKAGKYARAGVRELWLVDPRDRRVIIYGFEDGDSIGLYTLRDKVPVGIFGGELVIDFSEISGYLDELLGDTWGQEEDGQ